MNASKARPLETTDAGRAAGGASGGELASPFASPFARDDFDRDVWSVLGLPIDVMIAPQAVQAIEIAARDRRPLSFVTPNVNFLVRALASPEARRQIIDTDLSLVDGAPLVAIGRLAGVPLKERCAGSDVFEALRLRPGFAGRRLRVFFFGGREGAAAAAAAAVDAEQRGVESAGWLNPGHGDLDSMSSDAIIREINGSGADFVLVALGAAKGQAWIDRNRGRLDAPVVAHLGAVIDFAAGEVRRAPKFISRIGLEWAWRIKEDPALWRRYWGDGIALASIIAQRLVPALAAGGTGAAAPAAATLRLGKGGLVIALSGDLVASGRDPIRRAFRSAAAEGRDVILDFERAGRLDASFVGLVLMLEKNLRPNAAVIRLANAKRAHRRIFAANAIDYADVDPASPIGEGSAIAAAV